jgi:arylsulfatase
LAKRKTSGSTRSRNKGNGGQPNILVIWGDDIGISNLSCYTNGLTDSYGEQSCTAERSSFITGQSCFRTGLSKVGIPAAPVGLQAEDPTIAELLQPLGYATGQFGKNHLGDLNKYLPTVHAFDEFFGNLYHLNAEEDPESENYPPEKDSDTPFFCWVNTTHMHCFTHTKPESVGQAGRWQSRYHDTMIDHKNIGELLDLVDELDIAENTIVMYSTDNGPHMNTWPDGAMTPFRNEKNSNWEGAFHVPLLVRWPGKIPAGVVVNDIVQHHDWLPTFLAAAGEPDIVEKLKTGHKVGDKTFKVHIDGYNLLSFLTTEGVRSPRKGFIYFSDDGDLVAVRFDNWEVVFMEQRVEGTMRVWAEPFVPLRLPKLFNLRTDPYERADITSNTYYDWMMRSGVLTLAASSVVSEFLETFKEFPPRQRAASFTIDQAMEKMESVGSGALH